MSLFLDILYDLSTDTGLQLYPDSHQACKLIIKEDIAVQLEMHPYESKLIVASIITELPLGPFRENVLKHALVANNFEYPLYGYLCFIEKKGALGLCDTLTKGQLVGSFLVEYILAFADKVELWRNAINEGRPGPFTLSSSSKLPPPTFGIKT